MIYKDVISMIGKTPYLSFRPDEDSGMVYLKLEYLNPGGSVKDRAVLGMIAGAEKRQSLLPGGEIIEPTSGNTGISIAMIGRVKGYKVTLVMPDTMSKERRELMKAYGANLVLTPGEKGMKGAIAKAEELAKENPKAIILNQFGNPDNVGYHYQTTAPEITEEIPMISHFIAGVGTGGTLTGTGKGLKEYNDQIKVLAVEPEESPVISGGQAGPHKIQGIGAGFIPDNLDLSLVDGVKKVTFEDALAGLTLAQDQLGILVGISAGANISAAVALAKEVGAKGHVVTIVPDNAMKYLSLGVY